MAGFYSRPDLVLRTCKIVEDKTNNFLKIDFESLRKVVNKKSRVLIITNPCNPTAYGWDRKDYEELEKIMKDFPNLIVLEDASYFLYHS
jgi:aspartate/methionine/tyrosine aminotransferase